MNNEHVIITHNNKTIYTEISLIARRITVEYTLLIDCIAVIAIKNIDNLICLFVHLFESAVFFSAIFIAVFVSRRFVCLQFDARKSHLLIPRDREIEKKKSHHIAID